MTSDNPRSRSKVLIAKKPACFVFKNLRLSHSPLPTSFTPKTADKHKAGAYYYTIADLSVY